MGFFQSIRYLLRSAEIDNVVHKLHYRCTVLILLAFSFVITCRLLFGDSFSCISSNEISAGFLRAFCYARTPFLVLSAFLKADESLYPGVGKYTQSTNDVVFIQSFYPWVNLFFLVLAVLFYVPHLFWKIYERRIMARVTSEIDRPLSDDVSRENAINGIVKFLKAMHGNSSMYATAYLFTEVLNFVIDVLLTVWLFCFFHIGGELKTTDLKLLSWEDFFNFHFPLVGKCKFRKYGSHGEPEDFDILCLMPLNQLYGYMFLFLYAWFIMLCVLSACVMLYRLLVLFVPPLRLKLLRFLLLGVDHNLVLRLSKQYSFGDLILLNILKKNLLPHDFAKLVDFVLEKEHIGD